MRREDLPTGGHVLVVAALDVPGERLRAFNPGDRLYVDDPAAVPEEWLAGLAAAQRPPAELDTKQAGDPKPARGGRKRTSGGEDDGTDGGSGS